jgi:hypothetical protein
MLLLVTKRIAPDLQQVTILENSCLDRAPGIQALDSERSTMEQLLKQREHEPVNFGNAWRDAPFRQKVEMEKVFYPDGLVYSSKKGFFEPQNEYLFQQLAALFRDLLDVGVPDGI